MKRGLLAVLAALLVVTSSLAVAGVTFASSGAGNASTQETAAGLELTAVCSDQGDGTATYRIDSERSQDTEVAFTVLETDETGVVTVPAGGSATFTVDLNTDGSTTVVAALETEEVVGMLPAADTPCGADDGNGTDGNGTDGNETDSGDGEMPADGDLPVDLPIKEEVTICQETKESAEQLFVPGQYTVDGFTLNVSGTLDDGTIEVSENGEVVAVLTTSFDEDSGVVTVEHRGEVVATIDVKLVACDGGDGGDGHDGHENAYQVDLAYGEPIQNLGDSEDAFYGAQGRLITAASMTEDGEFTRTFRTAHGEHRTAEHGECSVSYGEYDYDPETGVLSVDVSAGQDCDGVTLSLAGYELPDGTQEFVRDRADEQELVDSQTVTLDAGENATLEIDLDG
ncbi:hypothetical protein ACFQPA_13575 [Halomarina halobia]|uniref:Uncharacterized protein n=1 Tax=Halomarina halobia TaxID=3033386 RepID=A0ABD6A8Z3_9EURY|nr:hypothetical protein [Halomarina sp. PSR21]